jgi:hypothetical protein
MSNQNSVMGWYNLPNQVISSTTETALLVPAQGAYPGLPSPTLAAAAGLFVGVPNDIVGSTAVDGHPFRVRVAGTVAIASGTFGVGLYQVPASISAAGTQATLTNDNSLVAVATTAQTPAATPNNFFLEATFLWDSNSQLLNGYYTYLIANLPSPPVLAITTQRTITSIANLQFLPSFKFSVGNAANNVGVKEFLIERV